MARHDREELDIELPDPISYLSFCYTIKGVEIDGNDPKAYCKKSVNTQTERTTYYAKFGRGVLFDPWGIFAGKESSRDFKFVKVSQTVFEHYYKYIEGKNRSFLSLAERSMIDV
jgi:hypothetical protein|tara:strand:+ start:1373 stop:1714 length:342 start_codon:yes stop_codon:yes gene_type:complete